MHKSKFLGFIRFYIMIVVKFFHTCLFKCVQIRCIITDCYCVALKMFKPHKMCSDYRMTAAVKVIFLHTQYKDVL